MTKPRVPSKRPDTKMTADFGDKPKTRRFADTIIALVENLGPSRRESRAQLTFGGKRKFIWLWTYGHTADGTLYVTVCLDRELGGEHFQYVKQVSTNRWNHHIVVKSDDQIDSAWFRDLVKAGYAFANQ
jgi:hypothetical protein